MVCGFGAAVAAFAGALCPSTPGDSAVGPCDGSALAQAPCCFHCWYFFASQLPDRFALIVLSYRFHFSARLPLEAADRIPQIPTCEKSRPTPLLLNGIWSVDNGGAREAKANVAGLGPK